MIAKETIDKVLDAVRIEEVVGDFVELKKRGAALLGLCPFHSEKTPSFNVSVSKGFYKCFGCGAGGDAVKFVMELEKYSYPEAIRYLAGKYGIPVEETQRTPEQLAAKDRRESLHVLSSWAGKFFREQLWDSEPGRAIGLSYFRERGYREDIIKKFELGYSPDQWTALCDAALAAGFQRDYLTEIGLAIERDGGRLYDRFRGRVIFPIHSLTGRVIAFGGRTLKTEKSVPKYVNSPESDIYHKSDVLYGLHFAKKAIADGDACYLVEGYADVISMHQAGVENVVSSSGTSLTDGQIRQIARFTKNVVVLYDGDAAGIQASLRGTDMLLEAGLNVKVLLFPDGNDPDSYVRQVGSAAFREYIAANQQDFIHYKTNALLGDAGEDPIKRAEVIREVVHSISLIPDEIKVSVFIRQCSVLLDIEERALLTELNKMRLDRAKAQDRKAERDRRAAPSSPPGDAAGPPADLFLTEEERAGADLPPSVPSEILQEREIVRILLNYGLETVDWEETDGDVPIAVYLLDGLDDISFEDEPSAYIVRVFREKIAHFELPEPRFFFSHEDKKVQELAVDSMSSRYEISPNWNDEKRKIYVPHERERLKALTMEAIYRIKKRKVQKEMARISEEMNRPQTPEDEAISLYEYGKWKETEKLLGAYLGNTVVK